MFTKALDEYAERYREKNNFSGVLRITLKDEIIYERNIGFDNEEKKIPFKNESMFTFYSLSKPFCALGFLKLCDKGLVSLDDHPAKYLKEAEGFNKNVKLSQLLNHTSGLPDCYLYEDFRNSHSGTGDVRKYVEQISKYPQYFEPGTDAIYTNINFSIPALIIENVTGMSYDEYMKKEVFLPLGMKTAIVDKAGLYIENRVQGYELDEMGNKVPVDRNPGFMFGAGDIVGRVDDVYCLNLAIKNRTLLKSETWDKVLTPSPFNHMGFGCTVRHVNGRLRITHNGGHTGFRTYHIQIPKDDLDIILLSNSGWGNSRLDFEKEIYRLHYGDTGLEYTSEMDKGYI